MKIVYCYECKYCSFDAFANAKCDKKGRYIFMYDKVCPDNKAKEEK